MKKMKTYAMIGAILFAVASLTACGTETGESSESTQSTLPINAYESDLPEISGGSKESEASKQPDKSGTSEPDASEPEESGSGGESSSPESSAVLPDTPSGGQSEKEKRLVPERGAAMTDETPLNLVFINGIQVDILDCTVQDIVKDCGVVHYSMNTHTRDIEALGYYFFGEGFTVGFDDDNVVQIEALERGQLIEKDAWQHQYDEEYEVASHYEVKAVSYGRYAKRKDFVTFCADVQVGMTKDEIDGILGRGLEIEIPDNDLLASASIYKTKTTTMVIEYEKTGESYTITVIKN